MPLIKRIGPYEFRFYSRGEAMERPHIHVTFADGRVLSAPLSWFPRLWHGTPAERQAVEI
jgi:hypothetical protein